MFEEYGKVCSRESMAGAVQVLALSDNEDNLSCAWNTPRSETQPRPQPEIRQCTPITPGDVVCLDSDDELDIQSKRTPVMSAKMYEPQQQVVQFETPSSRLKLDEGEAMEQCTPASAMKTPDLLQHAAEVDDCFIVQEKPSSDLKLDGGRRNVSLLDDCCIVKENPSSSWKVGRNGKSPLMDERPSCSSGLPSSATVVDLDSQETTVMSETRVQLPGFSRRRVEIFSIKEVLKQIPAMNWTSDSFENPEEIGRQAKRQKTGDVATPTSRQCDVEMDLESRHEDEEESCGGRTQKRGSRRQRMSEEERQERVREKELELERKQAERTEKKREKEEANKKQQEEIRQKKEEEKARKAAAKKAAQERKKAEHEVARFKGDAALAEMIASVDTRIVEKGLIGGQLLSRFGDKKLHYTIVSNPIANSITWRTKRLSLDRQESVDSEDTEVLESQGEITSSQEVHIQYILFVFEAEEFSTMVAESSLSSHAREAQQCYPGYTICYLVNRLISFLEKKEQAQYQSNDLTNAGGWQRPRVEKALAGLTTNFSSVHSRLCVDEADVADHVTGLMRIFANSLYKPKLTRLSVSKNGDHVRSADAFKEEIRKNLWLKALVAIPKVSGPCALAIGRTYPSMRSLLKVYLDNGKTDREKELLLQDIQRESVFDSTAGQRIGPVCSRHIFRVLMAQNGNLEVDRIDQDAHED